MKLPELNADCGNCAGLCCVALAFDKSDKFAFDKPAGVACQHLSATNRCQIHQSLNARGFAGCVQYDCLGAGQRVTQEVLPGTDWRSSAENLNAVMAAFRDMRRVHELLELLVAATNLPLNTEQAAKCGEFRTLLSPKDGWTPKDLHELVASQIPTSVKEFLQSLQSVACRK